MVDFVIDQLGWFFTLVFILLGYRFIRGLRGDIEIGPECKQCGYSRIGIPNNAPCPECGSAPRVEGSQLHVRKYKTTRSPKRIASDVLLIILAITVCVGTVKLDNYRLGYYSGFINTVRNGDLAQAEDYLNKYPELAEGRFRHHDGLKDVGGPLVAAAYSQHADAKKMIVLLLDHGADPNAPVYNEAFRFAMQTNDLELAGKLYEAGLDLSPDSQENVRDLLSFAVGIHACSPAFIEEMLKNGADPNHHNGRPAIATANDHPNDVGVVRLLLEYDADPNLKDNNGLPPIYQAILRASPAVVQELIDAGAELEFEHQTHGTPMEFAIRNARRYPRS